jgi:hypothetical protein
MGGGRAFTLASTNGGNTAAYCACACNGMQNAGPEGCSYGKLPQCHAECLGKTPNDTFSACNTTYAAAQTTEWANC